MDFVQIECWQYPGTSDTVFKHQTSSDNELLAWLREQPPKHQGVEPSGGLKVLIAESAGYSALSDPVVDPSVRANSDIERESNILQKAVAAFGLPDSILNLFALGLNTPAFFETVPQAERGSTMFLDFPYHRVAWLHVQATSSTSALFMSDAKSQKLQGHMAFWIEQFRQLADAPMLLAYLTCFLAVRQTGNMLDSNFDDIRILELQTGHNRRTERIDLRPGQLPQLSSKASGMAAAGTSRGMDVKKICSSIKDILRIMRANRDLPDPKQAAHHEKTVYLISSTKSLQRVVEAQKSYAEELKQRAIVQQTALFQLLAQKDQQLGLQIASDSRVVAVEARKDSSSMKTIATMTLIFLPPTFISVSVKFFAQYNSIASN